MAFGKISVVPVKAARPKKKPEQQVPVAEVKEEPKKQAPRSSGAVSVNMQVIANSSAEAADFLCGVYFTMSRQMAGSEISVYTREFTTITRLTELKQELEESILKPVGREIRRATPEEGEPLANCVLTVGQSANQKLTLDMVCSTVAPGAASGADFAVAVINWAEGPEGIARIRAAAAAQSCPVVWVVCGFESQKFFWAEDPTDFPKPSLRGSLTEELGISGKQGDVVAFAQVYGGLEFASRQADGSAVYRTHRKCREYMPVGCHAGIFAAMAEILRGREPDPAVDTLRLMLENKLQEIQGWYTLRSGKEGGK